MAGTKEDCSKFIKEIKIELCTFLCFCKRPFQDSWIHFDLLCLFHNPCTLYNKILTISQTYVSALTCRFCYTDLISEHTQDLFVYITRSWLKSQRALILPSPIRHCLSFSYNLEMRAYGSQRKHWRRGRYHFWQSSHVNPKALLHIHQGWLCADLHLLLMLSWCMSTRQVPWRRASNSDTAAN